MEKMEINKLNINNSIKKPHLYKDLYRVACRIRTLELENQQLKLKLKRVLNDKYVVLRRTDLDELVKKAKYQPPSISLKDYKEGS